MTSRRCAVRDCPHHPTNPAYRLCAECHSSFTPHSTVRLLPDVLRHIAGFLSTPAIGRLRRVSSHFYQSFDDDVYRERCTILPMPHEIPKYELWFRSIAIQSQYPARKVYVKRKGFLPNTMVDRVSITQMSSSVKSILLLVMNNQDIFVGVTSQQANEVKFLKGKYHALESVQGVYAGAIISVSVSEKTGMSLKIIGDGREEDTYPINIPRPWRISFSEKVCLC